MTRGLRICIAAGAIVVPGLHLLSDMIELANGGFTTAQLVINYLAFLTMPFVLVGLYCIQAPRAHGLVLAGALMYGASFVYFAHTTLLSLEAGIGDYATMWSALGWSYSLHGALMVAGGLLFATFSFRAGVLSRVGLGMFSAGLVLNLALAVPSLPDSLQIIGSTVRNLGLILIGFSLLTRMPAVR